MKRLFISLSVAAAVLSSCTTTMKTASTVGVRSSIHSAAVADLEVSPQRVTHTTTPSKAVQRGGLANVKRVAEAEALEKGGGGDFLLNPEYVISQRRGLFSRKITSVTVSGRPANYTRVRTLPDSVWSNPVFRGVTTTKPVKLKNSKEYLAENVLYEKPVKKLTWIVRAGVGSNQFAGGLFDGEEAGGHTGYSFGVEFNHAIGRKGFYWGMDLTFASGGYTLALNDLPGGSDYHYEYVYSEKLFSHGIHWTPIILGWKVQIPRSSISIDPHAAFYWGGNYTASSGEINGDRPVDAGFKLGVGIWIKQKVNVDFTYQRGLIDYYFDHHFYSWNYAGYKEQSDAGKTSNFMFRVGYAF